MPGTTEAAGAGKTRLAELTEFVTSEDLPWMVVDKPDLPNDLSGFDLLRELVLDNETMAKHGSAKRTAADLVALGRVNGYAREFAVPQGAPTLKGEPSVILEAATVAHLFATAEDVEHWIDEVFVEEIQSRIGQEEADGQKLVGVEKLEVTGFHDHAATLLVVHEVPGGVLASTIVDFRLGNLLGVAYVVAKEDRSFIDLASDLGGRLERQMVRVVLGKV